MKKKDSLLMLKYMISEGFKPENYERILELLQSAPMSLSQNLTEYNPYLLSKKVNYSELDKCGIDGAYGYLEDNEILVPKSLNNDHRFLSSGKTLFSKIGYGVPTINEFDTAIFSVDSLNRKKEDIYNAIINSSKFKNLYFGFITEKYPESDFYDEQLVQEFYQLMSMSSNYKISSDTISEENKILYLIEKK